MQKVRNNMFIFFFFDDFLSIEHDLFYCLFRFLQLSLEKAEIEEENERLK